jgi:hypothetical protein
MQANNGNGFPQTNKGREFDIERKHTAGQFLRAHPEALKVIKAQGKAAEGSFSLGSNARFKAA